MGVEKLLDDVEWVVNDDRSLNGKSLDSSDLTLSIISVASILLYSMLDCTERSSVLTIRKVSLTAASC